MGNDRLTICQISDIHCGNAYFIPDLLDRTIIEINRANPMAVVVSGDLTDAGTGKSSSKPQSTSLASSARTSWSFPAITMRAT